MAGAEDIRDGVSLEAWLEDRPREVAVAIASRAALRVMPIWAEFCLSGTAHKRDLTALPFLRLNLISSVAAVSPTDEVAAAAAAAAAANSNAANTAYAAAAAAYTAAAYAAYAAAAHADVNADYAVAALAANADTNAAYAAANAAASADAGAVWHSIRHDVGTVEQGGDCRYLPLWSDGNPLEEQWKTVRVKWSQPGSPYSFWLRWYENLLIGGPTNTDLLYRIALIPDEIWKQGAEAVAEEIERVEAVLYLDRSKERRFHDLQSSLDLEKARAASFERDLERNSELVNELSKRISSFQNELKLAEANARDRLHELETKYKNSFEAAIAAYREEQNTKAPVTLWQEKQREHETAATNAFWSFVVGLAVIILTAGGAVYAIFKWHDAISALFLPSACNPITNPSACTGTGILGFIAAGAVLTILSVLLWFTRLRMKIFLAERHLMLDARERRAFVQTYLGLLQEGDTSTEAREARGIVYHALYRPTSDGTVKDDGGLDVSIGAAISKILSK